MWVQFYNYYIECFDILNANLQIRFDCELKHNLIIVKGQIVQPKILKKKKNFKRNIIKYFSTNHNLVDCSCVILFFITFRLYYDDIKYLQNQWKHSHRKLLPLDQHFINALHTGR